MSGQAIVDTFSETSHPGNGDGYTLSACLRRAAMFIVMCRRQLGGRAQGCVA
jgi:hypothetical protein